MTNEQPNRGAELLKMVFQLHQLQQAINPHLPTISHKLVADLLSTGVPAKNIGRALNKSPGYVRAIAGGTKSLGVAGIVRVVQFAAAERKRQDDASAE